MDALEKIAAAVLYEGYVLWPYRRSARKNQQRWTFGGVYPRGYVETARSGDRYRVQVECLISNHGTVPSVEVELRFLHVVDRRPARTDTNGSLDFVDSLNGVLAWSEAVECRFPAGDIAVPAGEDREPVPGGLVVRSWCALDGRVDVHVTELRDGVQRVRVMFLNTSAWVGSDREQAQRRGFMSAHLVLRLRDGSFVSQTDPPPELAGEAEACQQEGLWPVLVSDEQTSLASPIILYDYPQVAPESPSLLFDSGEIDQLLLLNTMTLTDAEKAEIRATDPRVREILDRAESLSADDVRQLHGAIRGMSGLSIGASATMLPSEPPGSVEINGIDVRAGSPVRLHPRPGRDIFDLVLQGKTATVESVERDYENSIHLAVTIDDDPGRDLGMERMPGHRFFFSPEEVEPIL